MKNIICMICVVYSTFVWIYAGIIDFDMAYCTLPELFVPLIFTVITLLGFSKKLNKLKEKRKEFNEAELKIKKVKNILKGIIIFILVIYVAILTAFVINPGEVWSYSNFTGSEHYIGYDKYTAAVTYLFFIAVLICYFIFIKYIKKTKKLTEVDKKFLQEYYSGYFIRIIISFLWFAIIDTVIRNTYVIMS